MINYIFKRLFLFTLTFIAITFIVYNLQASFGRNPLDFLDETQISRTQNIETIKEQIAELHGLDKPSIIRYFGYIGGIFKGDFGKSIASGTEIPGDIFKNVRWTLLITFPTFILSVFIGLILGIISAYKRGKIADGSINSFVTFFNSIPSFVIAPIILFSFYKIFGLPLSFQIFEEGRVSIGDTILSMITPIFIFTITSLSGYTILIRNQMIAILSSNQVLIAKSKGLSTIRIFRKYVLRNVSIPLVGIIMQSFLGIFFGTIVLESFFGVPGAARLLLESSLKGEINVIMFNVVFFTGLSLLFHIIADVIIALLDPRIKFGTPSSLNVVEMLKMKSKRKKNKLEKGAYVKN